MEDRKLRIASRTSPLALFQTNEVIDRLLEIHTDWEFSIVPVSTKGDKDQSTSLQNLGQTGIFTKALDDTCLLYTSPSPRDRQKSRMPSSA